MSEASMGSTVRITNKFDRLFFKHTGKITGITKRLQDDGTVSIDYYVQASDLPHGRWFRRGEFDVIDEQASVKQ